MTGGRRGRVPGEQPDWELLRRRMVRSQIEGRGVRDQRVLEALGRVPRHLFVPAISRRSAYDDTPLPIGHGQTISQPYMVALMTEALCLRPGAKVLEVGTGSGYQAAVLAELACEVHTVECIPALAEAARGRLLALGYNQVRVHSTDGSPGLPAEAPFAAVLVTAGGPRVPEPLRQQLAADGGVLVIPVGNRLVQILLRVTRHGSEYREEDLGGCRFVPLVGEEGW
ncbi:MAG: protein-L-isoaspartate(D-aspartate) O-methyltransferase [Deferrisomatales bacterium]|nr:protein-L-isoaspartate(D-aspartate) O-methyltransferase [Deferrisomatales bacterium]